MPKKQMLFFRRYLNSSFSKALLRYNTGRTSVMISVSETNSKRNIKFEGSNKKNAGLTASVFNPQKSWLKTLSESVSWIVFFWAERSKAYSHKDTSKYLAFSSP